MAVSTAYAPISQAGNGVTTSVPIVWPFFTGTLVVVLVDEDGVETTKTLGTHYTVSGGTDSDGLPAVGTVTMLSAPASGETIKVRRSTPKTQATDWSSFDSFPEETIEAAVDKLTLIAQENALGGPDEDAGDTISLVTSGETDYWDAESHVIRNVADAEDDTDAVNYGQLQDVLVDAGAGDVVGPASALAGSLVAFDGVTGKLVKTGKLLGEVVSVLDSIPLSEHAAILAYTSTTDVTTYIQAAHDALGSSGGRLYFPPGKYRVSSALTFSKKGSYFTDGLGSVVIETTSASATIITLSASYSELRGFIFQCSTTRSSGSYVVISGNRVKLSDFWMEAAYTGVSTSGISVTIEAGFFLNGVATDGVAVRVTDGTDVTIRDVLVDAASQIAAGVLVSKAGDVTIEDSNIIHAGKALHLLATTGDVISSVWVNNAFFDTSTYGAYLDSTGGSIVRVVFDQVWFSSAAQQGVALTKTSGSGTLKGVEFHDCQFFLNGSHGILINNSAWEDVIVADCSIAQNTGDGINIVANVSKFSITACKIGAGFGLTANANGIVIASGTSNEYIIANNNLIGNTTAALSDAGTGTNKRVTGNLPASADQTWITYTPTISASSGSFTTVSAAGRYSHVGGGAIAIEISIIITTNGTAAGAVVATLPIAAIASSVLVGRENGSTGAICQGVVVATSTDLSITKADNSYPGGSGYVILMSGIYEV